MVDKNPGERMRQPKRSLQTILIVWFLLLSIVPVAFITGYSLEKFEQAIDNELVQRLRANMRELNATFGDYQKYLEGHMQKHEGDTTLITHLAMSNVSQAKSLLRPLIRNSLVTSLSLFNREGRLVGVLTQDEAADQRENQALESQNLFLAENYKETLEKAGRLAVVNTVSKPDENGAVELVMMTKLTTATGRGAGYIEEIVNIGAGTLENLKKRLSLEIILFDANHELVAASHPDFLVYPKGFFKKYLNEGEIFFELNIRDEPFGFILSPVRWGESTFYIGLGATKQKSKAILRNVNYAFFTVAGAIFLLVIMLALVGARVVLRPLNDLLGAIQAMEQRDEAVEIPVTSDNELGVLTESFNRMSRRVRAARLDLENKIRELEQAYVDLKDAQSKLVHSAKMVSLGQLVAGVAHELNNPIGFIYSNMTHLRDYSDKLFKLIDAAEKDPAKLEKLKSEYDFEYIVQDLPRLIQSCEDGSRRVRDIVVGLRNFSRLEEAKIKKISISESLTDTLKLLSGELKGRIQVHTEFAETPEVMCFASQLNQVFMNILSNAAQAIEGEGEIWIKTRHIPAAAAVAGSGSVEISIRDSGKGMSPEIQEKIFDPFFTTKSVGQGTGLGLSISYGIIRKHSGDISVKSELGKGTEFVVTLPVDGPPA